MEEESIRYYFYYIQINWWQQLLDVGTMQLLDINSWGQRIVEDKMISLGKLRICGVDVFVLALLPDEFDPLQGHHRRLLVHGHVVLFAPDRLEAKNRLETV